MTYADVCFWHGSLASPEGATAGTSHQHLLYSTTFYSTTLYARVSHLPFTSTDTWGRFQLLQLLWEECLRRMLRSSRPPMRGGTEGKVGA